jgi:hypothetical protein
MKTVLWQWAGESLNENEISTLKELLQSITQDASHEIHQLLTSLEVQSLIARTNSLIDSGVFPHPNPEWPHIPWPPF